jgi:hypothetical protein
VRDGGPGDSSPRRATRHRTPAPTLQRRSRPEWVRRRLRGTERPPPVDFGASHDRPRPPDRYSLPILRTCEIHLADGSQRPPHPRSENSRGADTFAACEAADTIARRVEPRWWALRIVARRAPCGTSALGQSPLRSHSSGLHREGPSATLQGCRPTEPAIHPQRARPQRRRARRQLQLMMFSDASHLRGFSSVRAGEHTRQRALL